MITKKRISDDILGVLTKFSMTDDHRFVKIDKWLSMKIDQIRAQLIVKTYQETGKIEQSWLTDLGLYSFNPVNFADDPSVTYCCADISKAFIPSVIEISSSGDETIDLGIFSIRSACGTKEYYHFPMSAWTMIPKEHIRSKFNYYSRVNTALYVNKKVTKLKIIAILASPEDGYLINSAPVLSGSIVSGTTYIVKGGQIIYNNVVRVEDSTFSGSGGATTFTGTGKVFLNNQLTSLTATQPYPVSNDMARDIVIEICTKEFQIEAGRVTDLLNDSADDQLKAG